MDAFARFYLESAPELVKEVGYIPLSDRAYEGLEKRLEARKTGSLFEGGSQVGVRIDDLLGNQGI